MTAPGSTSYATGTTGIAILGGGFDPPHRSHLRLAKTALAELPIGEVRIVPAGDHPHKQDRSMSPAADRLAMCRLLFDGEPGVVVDDRELRRAGLSYTVDTLAELAAERPGCALFFLIGSDNLPLLPTWHDHHRLLRLATVVTYPRRGSPVTAERLAGLDLSADERSALLGHVLPLPPDDVSATAIRQLLRQGQQQVHDLDPAVQHYAVTHKLYSR